MRDLAREAELEQRILEMAEEHGNKKWMRVKRTFFVLSGGIYLLILYMGLDSERIDIDIKCLLSLLGVSAVLAGFIMLISLGVLYHILDNTVKERIEIAKLEGKLIGMKYSDIIKDE